jgi:hypothetical protein
MSKGKKPLKYQPTGKKKYHPTGQACAAGASQRSYPTGAILLPTADATWLTTWGVLAVALCVRLVVWQWWIAQSRKTVTTTRKLSISRVRRGGRHGVRVFVYGTSRCDLWVVGCGLWAVDEVLE